MAQFDADPTNFKPKQVIHLDAYKMKKHGWHVGFHHTTMNRQHDHYKQFDARDSTARYNDHAHHSRRYTGYRF